jgi:hypothetical protein
MRSLLTCRGLPVAKKINPKMILADISAGMDKKALMTKYGLSAKQFDSAMRKLTEAGFLTGPQALRQTDAAFGAQAPSKCPACAVPVTRGLDECPKCGVIFAKYHMVEEPPPHDSSHRVALPDLLRGEAVQVEQKSPLVRIGALAGFVIIVAAAAFFFFRSSSETPESSPKKPETAVTAPQQSVSAPEAVPQVTETSEEADVDRNAPAPEGSTITTAPEDSHPETETDTSEAAVAEPPRQSTPAEDEAAAPTQEKGAPQSNMDTEKALDLLGESMIRDFDRAVRQWTSDDFKRFAARASQTLDNVSTEGLPDAIRQTGENLILQLRLESPDNAAEAFRQLAGQVRPELNGLSSESRANFIRAAQEIKRDVETSITR